MSRQMTVQDAGAGAGGCRRWRPRWLAAVAALTLVALSVLVGVPTAWAGSHGAGYEDSSGYFIGAYDTDVDGRQAYCIDLGANAPFDQTSAAQTVTSLDDLSRQGLAELNYVLNRWGQSADPDVTSAVALFVWSVADPDVFTSNGGDDHYIQRAPADHRAAILANLATMRQEGLANAVTDPVLSLSLSMSDQYAGTLTVAATPLSLTGPVQLTGGVFAGGGTSRTVGVGSYPITGTPGNGAPSYQVSASMSVDGAGLGARVDLYVTPGAQRLIAAVAGSSTGLAASTRTPVIPLDFQPQITTQVASRFVAQGAAFADQLTVNVTKGTWIKVNGSPVPVQATGTLYGPFVAQPTEAASPPTGAPVVGTVSLTLTGSGSYSAPTSLRAPASGFYAWVWRIDKNAQGQYGQYLAGSFTDRFARAAESSVVPFQPVLTSQVGARLADPGQATTDTIQVFASNGDWLKVAGAYVPVTFEATVLQVPGTRPPTVCGGIMPTVMAAASTQPQVIATVTLTATGPGTYTSPPVTLPTAGFVTWVWSEVRADQPATWQDYVAGDWQDSYGQADETTSVRWPATSTSQLREYNIAPGGRAFDTITLTGFPDDHGDYAGDRCWNGDLDEVTHTVYGPFATASVLTDDLDLSSAPVLTRLSTPARNGTYELGWTDQDAITPTEPGYYVVVSSFTGDDRVAPFQSSPADVHERFYVPPATPGPTPVSVITQATTTAQVGEAFDDVALVQGSTIPDGVYLVFRAYGPQPSDEDPVCEQPAFESAPVPVVQPGVYRSPAISVTEPGDVHWVETLYAQSGQILVQGVCGAPGETTNLQPPPAPAPTPTPTPSATPTPTPSHTPGPTPAASPTPTAPAPSPAPSVPPATPPSLAQTGARGLVPLGIAAGLFVLAGAGMLWFGRRLAIYRERNGYVREEDRLDDPEPGTDPLDQ